MTARYSRRRHVALAVLVAATAVLCGCNSERDFDERYEAANKQILKTAEEIDAGLGATGAPAPEETTAP